MKTVYVLATRNGIDEEAVLKDIKKWALYFFAKRTQELDAILKEHIQKGNLYKPVGETIEKEDTDIIPDSIKKGGKTYRKSETCLNIKKDVLEIYYLHPSYEKNENKNIEDMIEEKELNDSLKRIKEETKKYLTKRFSSQV